MTNLMNAAAQQRLSEYFDCIGALLGRKGRRESFALYAEGVLGDGERKSIEPIAARACADPAGLMPSTSDFYTSRSTHRGATMTSAVRPHVTRSRR